MPFTLAHAVVALPFRRSRLPVAGVAAGAMVPDLPLFVPIGIGYTTTHAEWAAPTVDVLLGLMLLVLWGVVLRPALVAIAPPSIAARLPADADRPGVPRPTVLLLVALAVGALTHVAWDAFTHRGRWGTFLLPVLQQPAGPVVIASWLQYASSVLGVLLLVAWTVVVLARTPPRHGAAVLPAPARRIGGAAVALALVAGGVLGAVAQRGSGVAPAAFAAATSAIDAAGAVLVVLGVALALRSPSP